MRRVVRTGCINYARSRECVCGLVAVTWGPLAGPASVWASAADGAVLWELKNSAHWFYNEKHQQMESICRWKFMRWFRDDMVMIAVKCVRHNWSRIVWLRRNASIAMHNSVNEEDHVKHNASWRDVAAWALYIIFRLKSDYERFII